ncbi:MAG: hypothetical protein KDJ16_17890 [Hyphomicrobiales bacterium]|nr:hypothetical protein [Hyphomicrobiales bacterium]
MIAARYRVFLSIFVFLSLLIDAQPLRSAPADWYAERGSVAPKSDKIVICHGYGCVRRSIFQFSPDMIAQLRDILAAGHESPEAERTAISAAVRWFETSVRGAFHYPIDDARSPIGLAGEVGQMDCIDEATNTTSLLLVIAHQDLLAHHRVLKPVSRGFFLDLRGPHATAVIAETGSGERFAVDSWVRAGGAEPDVMPLKQWYQEGNFTSH